MQNALTVLAGTWMAASLLMTASEAHAQQVQTPPVATSCVTQNMAVPPGANTTDNTQPFFVETPGLDLSAQPPRRDPNNPNYPRATELPDGTLPPPGAEGNFI